jgi:hypothetical protein
MPTVPYVATPIQTLLLADDARNRQPVHVIDGANFYFDSEGPKSGFAVTLISPYPFGQPRGIQGIESQGRYFVFTQDAILVWRTKVPFIWEPIYAFEQELLESQQGPWSLVYIAGVWMFAQKGRGLFKGTVDEYTEKIVVTPWTSAQAPGILDSVYGVGMARNRLILFNDALVQWSEVEGIDDFTPSPGGANFIAIRDYVAGRPIGLLDHEDGFTVWTHGGGMAAEFVGGDFTWRVYPKTSTEHPLSAWCKVKLSESGHVILTQHGLFLTQSGQDPQPWTPEFNEFFLTYTSKFRADAPFWRLEYDIDRQIIYVMESNDGITFWRSFVLTPTRNKWGLLSRTVFGLLPFSEGRFGLVCSTHCARYFTDAYYGLSDPDESAGCDRHYPRYEKGLSVPSTSAVARASTWDPTIPGTLLEIPAGDWYAPASRFPGERSITGLSSWIEFGYLAPENLSESIDVSLEIQEIRYGSVLETPNFPVDFTTEHKESLFYWEEEDWDYTPIVAAVDIEEDLMDESGSEDLMNLPDDQNVDFMQMSDYTTDDSEVPAEDWNELSGDEDWGGVLASAMPLSSALTIRSSDDGYTYNEFTPVLAKFDAGARTLTTIAPGTWHRVRIQATEPFEYYHVKYFGVTFEYGGQAI